jgi:hypothetical protein
MKTSSCAFAGWVASMNHVPSKVQVIASSVPSGAV